MNLAEKLKNQVEEILLQKKLDQQNQEQAKLARDKKEAAIQFEADIKHVFECCKQAAAKGYNSVNVGANILNFPAIMEKLREEGFQVEKKYIEACRNPNSDYFIDDAYWCLFVSW